MEKIRSFVLDGRVKKLPFYVELAGITYPTPSYDIRRESSECCVLEYVMDGCGTVEVNSEEFFPSAGDVYLLPHGSRHHYYASKDTPFQKIWMNVNGPLCGQLLSIYRIADKYYFKSAELFPLFEEFLAVCESGDGEEIHSRCAIIFHKIVSALATKTETAGAVNEFADRAKSFCDRNVYAKISTEDVSAEVGLSASQLGRIFKREYGVTLYAYILDGKINTAKTLLAGTSMQVNEIAYMLRFTDEHYFTNIFKKKTGMTPTEWRRH